MKKLLHKTRGWKLPFMAVIALVFALLSVFNRPSVPAAEPYAPPASTPYQNSIAGIGVVEPASELIDIGADISGVVRKIYVIPGDKVKAGDPIFALDMREIDATIVRIKADLVAVKIQAEDAASQFALVKDITDNKAVARDDYNRRKYNSQLGFAKVAETEAQLEQARVTKERLTVKAPISGEILEVNIQLGEFAATGILPEPLVVMGNTNPLHVRVEIDQEKAPDITKEAEATGFQLGDTLDAIPLKFVRFEPLVRPKENLAVAGQRVDTRVLQVIYALPKEQKKVFVGQQMDVYIAQNTKEE